MAPANLDGNHRCVNAGSSRTCSRKSACRFRRRKHIRVAWITNTSVQERRAFYVLRTELLDKHVPGPGEADLRGFEWHYLNRLFHGEVRVLQAHAGYVRAIDFTWGGKRLVSCGTIAPRRNMNERRLPGEIKMWDIATGRQLPLGLNGRTDKVLSIAASPDGTRLAAAYGDEGIRLWDLMTGQLSTLSRHAKERDAYVRFSPDGKTVVVTSLPDLEAPGSDWRTVRVWDLAGSRVVVTLDKLGDSRTPIEFSPDGKLMAFADGNRGRVQVFDAFTGWEAFTCKYEGGRVGHAMFSPDGKRLAACGDQGVQIWDTATQAVVATLTTAFNLGEFLTYHLPVRV
jgi:WD40 repeat protein